MNIYPRQIRAGLQHRGSGVLDHNSGHFLDNTRGGAPADHMETLLLVYHVPDRWEWDGSDILWDYQACVLYYRVMDNLCVLVLVWGFILLVCVFQVTECGSCVDSIDSLEISD